MDENRITYGKGELLGKEIAIEGIRNVNTSFGAVKVLDFKSADIPAGSVFCGSVMDKQDIKVGMTIVIQSHESKETKRQYFVACDVTGKWLDKLPEAPSVGMAQSAL